MGFNAPAAADFGFFSIITVDSGPGETEREMNDDARARGLLVLGTERLWAFACREEGALAFAVEGLVFGGEGAPSTSIASGGVLAEGTCPSFESTGTSRVRDFFARRTRFAPTDERGEADRATEAEESASPSSSTSVPSSDLARFRVERGGPLQRKRPQDVSLSSCGVESARKRARLASVYVVIVLGSMTDGDNVPYVSLHNTTHLEVLGLHRPLQYAHSIPTASHRVYPCLWN